MSNLLEFHQAVVRGDLPEVERLSLLVENIDDVLDDEHDDEMKIGDEKFIDYRTLTSSGTALMKAACYGHIDIVNYLLSKEASAQEANDYDGRTAIEYAATIGRADIVDAILRAYAATADAEEISHQKMCAFGIAIRGGKNDVIRLLLSNGIEVDQPREDGATALIRAAEFGQTETVQCLLEYGANMEAKDAEGYTALLAAAETKSSSTLELLVKSGADIQAMNQKGEKAIACAARRGNVDSTMILLLKHAMSAPETLAEAWQAALTSAIVGGSCDVIYEMFKNKDNLIEETGVGKAETAKALSLATTRALGSCFTEIAMRSEKDQPPNAKIALSLLALKASKEEFDGLLANINPVCSVLEGVVPTFSNTRDELLQLREKAGHFRFEISAIFDEQHLTKILYDFYEDLGVPSNSPQGSSAAAASAADRGRE